MTTLTRAPHGQARPRRIAADTPYPTLLWSVGGAPGGAYRLRWQCHGAGVAGATGNTRELAEEWLAAWKHAHPNTVFWSIPAAQLSLPFCG